MLENYFPYSVGVIAFDLEYGFFSVIYRVFAYYYIHRHTYIGLEVFKGVAKF